MKIRKISWIILIIAVLVGSLYTGSYVQVQGEESGQVDDDNTSYIIRKGDTLWDISDERLKNPFFWPNIWEENRYIRDPDLIYPGNRLIIPYGAPSVAEPGGSEPPLSDAEATLMSPVMLAPPTPPGAPVPASPESPPEPSPEPSMTVSVPANIPASSAPPSLIGTEIIEKGGYISDDIESVGIISGSREGKNIYAAGDIVNIILQKEDGATVGSMFTIFRPPAPVSHPKTGEKVGMLFTPVGVIEITRVQGTDASGRIIKSYTQSSPGDHIQPYRSATPVYGREETSPGIYGYIIETQEGRMLNAAHDIVYLDRGTLDGVAPGTIFHVIAEREDDVIGEIKVISVQAATSTALIIKSVEPFSIGSKIVTPAAR